MVQLYQICGRCSQTQPNFQANTAAWQPTYWHRDCSLEPLATSLWLTSQCSSRTMPRLEGPIPAIAELDNLAPSCTLRHVHTTR